MLHSRFTELARKNGKVILFALLVSLLLSGIYFFAERNDASAGTLIPWRSAILGFLGFAVLFWLADRKRLPEREKDFFIALHREAHPAAMMLEGIYQVALAAVFFLLFYLLARERWNLFLCLFCGIASLICAAGMSLLEIPAVCRKVLICFAYCVLLAYSAYNLTMFGYTALSEQGGVLFLPIVLQSQRWIHISGLILVILQFRTDARRALALCLTGLISYFVWRDSSLPLVLEFVASVLLSNLLGKPRTIAKVFLTAFLVFAAFLAAGLAAGWVENRMFYFDYAGSVPSFGMGHSNLPALLLMSILLLVWYLWLAEHPVITFPVFWAAAAGIWFMTYCRTVVIVLVGFPLVNLICGIAVKRKMRRSLRVIAFLPLIFAALSVFCMYWIPVQKLFSTRGNFFARFYFPYLFIRDYGISIFGTTVRGNAVMDNLFLHLFSYFGVASVILVSGLLTWVGLQYCRNKQYNALVILVIIMVYSLMENAIIHQPFGFAAMLTGAQPNIPEDGKIIKQIVEVRNKRAGCNRSIAGRPSDEEW